MTAGESKVRVLIVDDIAETRENIRKLLQFDKELEVVGAVGTGRSGVEQAHALKPDVVLMDINMPDMDGITATEMIRRQNPSTQIVILSVQGDPNYMRRAMLAGARDFLTKPPAVEDLTSAIRRAGQVAIEERAKATPVAGFSGAAAGHSAHASGGKLLVVYSPKGGGGATTLAVNLAVTLQNEETPVALVDANLQFGDVPVFLNEQVRNSVLDLAPRTDELEQDVVRDVMIIHAASGINILAAPEHPEYAENVSGDQFARILKYLRMMYAYIIVDASSALTDVVLSAMDAGDLMILLTSQEIPAIKSARQFLNLAEILNLERKRILLVLNRYDKRIGILPEKISENLKHEMTAVIPFDDRTVIPSVNRGVPFMLGDRTRPVAKSILTIAEIVRRRITEMNAESVEKMTVTRRQ